MPLTEYDFAVEQNRRDWIRIRIDKQRGRVIHYTAQYETEIDGERGPVIRHDSAHGFPHIDVLNRRGEVVSKTPLPGTPSLNDALQIAVADLKRNWKAYRARFLGERR